MAVLTKLVENDKSEDDVLFLSYNSTGFNLQRAEFLTDLITILGRDRCLISLQEHFLMSRSLKKIEESLPDNLCIYSVAAFKEFDIRRGRGKGGLSMIWPKRLDKYITRLPIKTSKRVQACMLNLPGCRILWLNTYFPTDPQTQNFDDTDLRETIAAIKAILDNNEHDEVLWQGDLNADFLRNSKYVQVVKEAIEEINVKSVWNKYPVDFTYCSPTEVSFSTIDHSLVTETLDSSIKDAGVIHLGDNVSGHSPIYLKLNIGSLPCNTEQARSFSSKQNWQKATHEDKINFKAAVSESLSNVQIPAAIIDCNDVNCTDPVHRVNIDGYTVDIIKCLESSAETFIPYTRPKQGRKSSRRKSVPGWVELVKPHQEKAKFWYQVWFSAAKPRAGQLFNIMRFTRNQFRLARRKCLKAVETIKRDRFIKATMEGDRDMFEELNKIKKSGAAGPSKMDGKTNADDIADHFGEIYKNIYNREGSDEPLKNLLDDVNTKCSQEDLAMVERVTGELIKQIVKEKLKSSKTDPEFDVTSDALKNSPDILFNSIASLFRCMLIHGHVCFELLVCAIIPLIKDKNGKDDDSNNYRGIALSSLFLKIFDWVLLILFDDQLRTDQNQFGFEAGSSTSMCSWTVVEVVNYFSSKGSPVFAALLDYRKAFDYVNHVKMFRNLMERGVNLVFLRLLMFIYLYQRCYIRWQASRSYSFSVTNGTRQGSIFSPRGGFNTYLDPMLEALRRSGFGCSIGTHFFGAVAYADDVLIMSTSVQGLQEMVSICQKHAEDNNLVFSTDPDPKKSKTMCIAFNCSNRDNLAPIQLCGDNLPWVSRAKHIGNFLHEDGTTDHDIRVKKGIFIQNAMDLDQEFHCLPADLKMKLNLLYNSHFSSSSIWRFESEEACHLFSSWNKNIKLIYDLPWATHRWILEEITGSNLKVMLFSRFVKFLNAIKKSTKPALKYLLSVSASDVRSLTGSNMRSIQKNTGIQVTPGVTHAAMVKKKPLFKPPEEQMWKIPLLHSLLAVKAENFEICFDDDEDEEVEEYDVANEILMNICCS